MTQYHSRNSTYHSPDIQRDLMLGTFCRFALLLLKPALTQVIGLLFSIGLGKYWLEVDSVAWVFCIASDASWF